MVAGTDVGRAGAVRGEEHVIFAPLVSRDFRTYYVGQTASAFGDSLTPFAMAFAVLHLTGSPVDLGVVVLSTRLPVIVLTLLGGAVGDRFPRRTVLLIADVVRFAAHGVTAVLLLTGAADLWTLVALQLVAGVGTAFFNPAATGLVGSLVGKDELQAANSLIALSRSAASILALAAAGALVALVGPGWAVLIDALTFLVSACFVALLPRALDGERTSGGGLPASIRGGFSEVAGRPWLWVWIAHSAFTNLVVVSPILVLGPYVADQHLGGAPAWSAIGIAYAAGGVAGGVLGARWRPERPMAMGLLIFLLMAPLPALLAVPAGLWALVPAGLAAGLQLVVYNVLQTTAIQRHVPEARLSRVTSVALLGSLVAAPIGMALAGPAADLLGTRPLLVGCAVLAVVATGAALAAPSAWRLRADPRGSHHSGGRIVADGADASS